MNQLIMFLMQKVETGDAVEVIKASFHVSDTSCDRDSCDLGTCVNRLLFEVKRCDLKFNEIKGSLTI